MTKHFVMSLAAAALVACGSKAAPAPTITDVHDTTAVAAPASAPVVTADPVQPPEPEPPAVDPEQAKTDALAVETTAYEKAKPVFAKYCASCHTKKGKKADAKKLGHFDMTTYPFGGEHARSIGNEIRVVLALDGARKATMPSDKPGSVKGDDLAAIDAWTSAWRAAGAAGVHPADPADKDDD